MKTIAVVTGASSGMGWEFVRQLDLEGCADEIWLVARRKDKLEVLAQEVKNSKPVVVEADLSTPEGPAILSALLARADGRVEVFVNNAGFGTYGPFQTTSLTWQLQEVDLNVRAVTELSHLALKYMGPRSRLINVASLAGFQPLANFAVYAATKAYVHHFSLALRAEVAHKGIRVTSLCPGPVATEFSQVASQGVRKEVHGGKSAEKVVKKALRDSLRGRGTSILGLDWYLLPVITKILPKSFFPWWTIKFYQRPSPPTP